MKRESETSDNGQGTYYRLRRKTPHSQIPKDTIISGGTSYFCLRRLDFSDGQKC